MDKKIERIDQQNNSTKELEDKTVKTIIKYNTQTNIFKTKNTTTKESKNLTKQKKNCKKCIELLKKIDLLEKEKIELLEDKENLKTLNEKLLKKNTELSETVNRITDENKSLKQLNMQLIEDNKFSNNKKNFIEPNIESPKKQSFFNNEELINRIINLEKWKKDFEEKEKNNKELILFLQKRIVNTEKILHKILNTTNQIKLTQSLKPSNRINSSAMINNTNNVLYKENSPEKITKKVENEDESLITYRGNSYEKNTKISKSLTISSEINNVNNSVEINGNKNNIIGKNYKNTYSNTSVKTNNKLNNKLNKNKFSKFNSKIICEPKDLDLIARGLVKNKLQKLKDLKIGYKLIYRATEDGPTAKNFHESCDNAAKTLTVIKTLKGWIFGGYTEVKWEMYDNRCEKKNDYNSFVFSLNLKKLYFPKKNSYSIYCDKKKGPTFIGMFCVNEKILDMKSEINPFGLQCYVNEDEDYEINGGSREFEIEELEVFEVLIKNANS